MYQCCSSMDAVIRPRRPVRSHGYIPFHSLTSLTGIFLLLRRPSSQMEPSWSYYDEEDQAHNTVRNVPDAGVASHREEMSAAKKKAAFLGAGGHHHHHLVLASSVYVIGLT
jgi:hypothetical protein